MIKENLVAERIAIETYQDMVRHFGNNFIAGLGDLSALIGSSRGRSLCERDWAITVGFIRN